MAIITTSSTLPNQARKNSVTKHRHATETIERALGGEDWTDIAPYQNTHPVFVVRSLLSTIYYCFLLKDSSCFTEDNLRLKNGFIAIGFNELKRTLIRELLVNVGDKRLRRVGKVEHLDDMLYPTVPWLESIDRH